MPTDTITELFVPLLNRFFVYVKLAVLLSLIFLSLFLICLFMIVIMLIRVSAQLETLTL